MRVCIIAAPLTARSGVFMSTLELVRAARSAGLEWSAVMGLRPAIFADAESLGDNIESVVISEHGMSCIREIENSVLTHEYARSADVVITMIAQSDIAMSRSGMRTTVRWVPFVRGLPWPGRGEAAYPVRVLKRVLESRALRKASEVWATTPRLAMDIASAVSAVIVPAGVAAIDRNTTGREPARFIWAGRLDHDKDPLLFAKAMERVPAEGVIFGRGPLEAEVLRALPSNVTYGGWVDSAALWAEAGGVFVGTSVREAFGRSAVEAAFAGKPTILGAEYGCAEFLVTDTDLKRQLIVDSRDPDAWGSSLRDLVEDAELRAAASDHVRSRAEDLTIEKSVEAIHLRLENIATRR